MNIGSLGAAATQVPQATHHAQSAPAQGTAPAQGRDSDGDNDGSTTSAAAGAGSSHAVNVVA